MTKNDHSHWAVVTKWLEPCQRHLDQLIGYVKDGAEKRGSYFRPRCQEKRED
jgi:hypothetical protein